MSLFNSGIAEASFLSLLKNNYMMKRQKRKSIFLRPLAITKLDVVAIFYLKKFIKILIFE